MFPYKIDAKLAFSLGKLVLTQPLPQNATEFCMNVITTDAQGQKTAVPVAVNTGGRRGVCSVYQPGTPVYQHLYGGNTEGLKEMSQTWTPNFGRPVESEGKKFFGKK